VVVVVLLPFSCQGTRVKRSTTQVAVVVAEVAAVAAVAAVDDEDSVQWRRWGGHSMAAASFDGGYTTTSRRTTRG